MDRLARRLALGGVVGPIFFVASFTLAGFMRPGYSPIRQAISALGTGPDGWREDVPAMLLGASLLLFTVSFVLNLRHMPPGEWQWLAPLLLAVFAVVWIVVGVFTAARPTVAIHSVAAVMGQLAVVGAFAAVGIGLRGDSRWRPWGTYSLAAAAASALLVALLFLTAGRGGIGVGPSRVGGLVERTLVIEALAWFVAFGWRLCRASGVPAGSAVPPRS